MTVNAAARAPRANGFTLMEMVVALALFSLAAMALLNLSGQNTRTAGALERRAFAQVLAENLAVEAAIGGAEAFAPGAGEATLGARAYRWERRVAATGDPQLVRIEIAVREGEDPQTLASIALFRKP